MVEDPEIAAELTKIKQDEDDLQAVEQQIEKVMVPKVNYPED